MNIEHELKQLFSAERLRDIILPGYVDQGPLSLEFHPMLWWIYVAFERSYLRFEARNQWHLKMDVVNQIQRDFEVDENDQFCVASAGQLHFTEIRNSGYAIKGFTCLLDDDSNLTTGVIKAGGFYLDSG